MRQEGGVDWAGRWFDALDEVGEFTGIRFGRLRPGRAEPEWTFLPHREFDGIGGFAELLSRQGVSRSHRMPELARKDRPHWPARARAFLRHLNRPIEKAMQWRRFDGEWQPVRPELSQPGAVGWVVLSEAESSAALGSARRHGVSLNSLMLWALCRASLPRLVPASGRQVWMITVNMRGAVALPRPTQNHAAFVDLVLDEGAPLEAVHSAVRASLGRHSHWGAWHAIGLARWLGPKGILKTVRKLKRDGRRRTGAFSNLGDWPETAGLPGGDAWLFCPPVMRFQPVGAGCIGWKGRYSLTLQLHPVLDAGHAGEAAADAQTWAEDWKRELCGIDGSIARS